MSILEKTNGILFPIDNRYYSIYTANSTLLGDDTWWVYNNGLLGDATKEVANTKLDDSNPKGLWYSDNAYFSTATKSWIGRGGSFVNGKGAGILNFSRDVGIFNICNTFRIILAY